VLKRTAEVTQSPLICIIDDDEAVRVATESLVRSLGFRVITFASAEDFFGSAALDAASCFITAFPEERMRQSVHAAGAIGFLSKPFDGGAMIQCIERALSWNIGATHD
jgi:FixJ family two-component response regulator